jgi:hypothetical protein
VTKGKARYTDILFSMESAADNEIGVHGLKEKQICQTDGMTNTAMREEVLPLAIAIIHAEAVQAETTDMMTDAEALQVLRTENVTMRTDRGILLPEEASMMMTAGLMQEAVPDHLPEVRRAERQNAKREPW